MQSDDARSVAPRWRAAIGFAVLTRLLAGLVAGCTVGPDYQPPKEPEADGYTAEGVTLAIPGSTQTAQHLTLGKKISGEWWKLLHSPPLDAVLAQAIVGNRSLAAATATLDQAQETVNQTAAQRYPRLDLTAGISRQKSNLAASGSNQSGSIFNLYSIGPNLSYTLDLFGGVTRQIEQQQALAEFQAFQLTAAYLTLTGNAVTQAVQIASLRAQIKAVEDIVADDERNLDSVRSLFEVRHVTRMDVQSALSQLTADRTLLPPLRQQLSVARHALAVLIGRPPAEWTPPDFELADFVLPEELPVSLPSSLVHQRPDILASESQLHAASAAIGVAAAQLYPNITLSGAMLQQALTTTNLFSAANSGWNIMSNLTAPIFHGGALEAQRRAAENAFQSALANYEQTVLQSFGQVADLLDALAHDAELLDDQQQALDSARLSLSLTRDSFASGNASLLQVLDAERLYQQARLGYARAQAQRFLDTTQLFVAMGGGWWEWQSDLAAAPS